MDDISFEDIAEFNDVFQMCRLATKMGVVLAGCKSLEDCRERFVLHKRKLSENITEKIDHATCETFKTEIGRKRKTLIPVFESVGDIMSSDADQIRAILETRSFCRDIRQSIQNRLESLKSGEDYIVVLGATSSGKSMFLNLVLGMNILPVHTLSCTSTICKIKFSIHFSAKVYKTDGSCCEYSYANLGEAKSHLENLIFVRDRTKQNLTAVHIYLPADILKCGITLIDTPSFDENETMENLVREFITTNHVAAFIYMVKTDQLGGITQNGLLRILDTQRLKKTDAASSMESFNPGTALFVCNRWDLVPESEKETVKNNTLKTLSNLWTGLHPSQVFFFSTKNTQTLVDIDQDYKTIRFRHLLYKLNNLIVTAMNNSIDTEFRWIRQFVAECSAYMKTITTRINSIQKEQKNMLTVAEKKLEALRTRAFQILNDIRSQINEESIKMTAKTKAFLQSRDTRMRIQTWREEEIPFHDLADCIGVPWNEIREQRDLAIMRKIFDILDTWEESSDFAARVSEQVTNEMKKQLYLLDVKIEKISDCYEDKNSWSFSRRCNALYDEDNLAQSICRKSSCHGLSHSLRRFSDTGQKSIAGSVANFLASKIVDPVTQALEVRAKRRSAVNPLMYMVERADKVVKAVASDESTLMNIVARYAVKELEYLDKVEKNIPKYISASERLIAEVRYLIPTVIHDADQLKKMMKALEKQKQHLDLFQEMYMTRFPKKALLPFSLPGSKAVFV